MHMINEEEAKIEVLNYFKGDQLATDVWWNKYRMDVENICETHPQEMFDRCTKNLSIKETDVLFHVFDDITLKNKWDKLSTFGNYYFSQFKNKNKEEMNETVTEIYSGMLNNFNSVVLGGSMYSGIGNLSAYQSLSNCFVLGQPHDSYSGIISKEHEAVQVMKRRGGIGLDLSTIRPEMSEVHNQSKYACGPLLFLYRYSNATREVSQNGRRGALMASIRIEHPDAIKIINVKRDKTKVTGANVSIIVSDEFMDCLFSEKDFIQRFPVTASIPTHIDVDTLKYNEKFLDEKTGIILQRINPMDLWHEIVRANYECAEPGIMWEGRFIKYSTDGVYPQFKYVTSNPCFAGKTPVLTDKGYFQIADLNGQTVNVWNGEAWSAVTPKVTGTNQQMLEVTLSDGTVLENTVYHKYPVYNVYKKEEKMVEAENLKVGDRISKFNLPVIEISHCINIKERLEYLENIIIKEGSVDNYTGRTKIYSENLKYLNDIKLSLTTLGTHSKLVQTKKGIYFLNINAFGMRKLKILGLRNFANIDERYCPQDNTTYVRVVSVKPIPNADKVYCFNEPIHHKAVFNGILLGQCGEIGMGEYDACRLLALNLFSCVKNPFSMSAELDYKLLYENSYKQLIMANTIIDLEVDYIKNIIDKIEETSGDKELMEMEKGVWMKILNVCQKGRRCGCGFLGLGDMLASLNLSYNVGSIIEEVMKIKMRAELDASIDLSIIYKPFEGWDSSFENNDMFSMILWEFPEQYKRMQLFGRRNVSWSTLAPTGSGGIISQLTGGIEPLFLPYYKRRKKCMTDNDRVDYVDVDGEKFTEYFVIHPKLKMYCDKVFSIENWDYIDEDKLKRMYEMSPYFGNCAGDIKYEDRINMQSLIQKYTTHSISSTINLPKDTKVDTIDAIYREAYIKGLKGVTVYRDGSRGGIMVTNNNEDKSDWFEEVKAPKRPDILDAKLHLIKYNNDFYCVVIGLLNNKPYECFVCYVKDMPAINYPLHGQIVKRGADYYCFYSDDIDINNIGNCDSDTKIFGLLVSGMLRHRVPLKKIVKTFRKADMLITDFSNKILHVLSEYIPDGETDDYCEECWEKDHIKVKMTYQGGCCICPNGHSKC